MVRASQLPHFSSPTISALRHSLLPALTSFSLPSRHIHNPIEFCSPKSASANFTRFPSLAPNPVPLMLRHPLTGARASFSAGSSSGGDREILVQHLLVKEDDVKLLSELLQRISGGEDLSDLAAEYSICPSKEEGGMLGWVRKGQMVPEFEEAAFNAPLNKVVKCKTKFGWHLLQVLSEREESIFKEIQPEEFHAKMQDPGFYEDVQLIDVREPDEVEQAALPGFQVLPLRQFGSWGPEITKKLDPKKDTYVMCHHGMRSLQIARWLQTQGFAKVFNLSGGIHAYATKVDSSIPTY